MLLLIIHEIHQFFLGITNLRYVILRPNLLINKVIIPVIEIHYLETRKHVENWLSIIFAFAYLVVSHFKDLQFRQRLELPDGR